MERGRVKQQNKPPVKIFNLNISYMLGYHDFSEVMNIYELLYIMWAHLLIPGCHKLINWYFSACTSPNTFRVVLFIHLQENLVSYCLAYPFQAKYHWDILKQEKMQSSLWLLPAVIPIRWTALVSQLLRISWYQIVRDVGLVRPGFVPHLRVQLFQGQEGSNVPHKLVNQNVA